MEFEEIRGKKGIKKATVQMGKNEIKVAVAHGLANAKTILEEIKAGKADYQFVEIMACPGACGLAPVFTVNDEVYGNATPELLDKIIDEYMSKE